MDAQKFKQVVQKLIREELKSQLRPAMKEIMAEMLVELTVSKAPIIPNSGNSRKARNLREVSYLDESELEEYPSMNKSIGFDKSGFSTPHRSSKDEITLEFAASENGNMIPISPEAIPESVRKAINKDYSGFMETLNTFKKV